MSTLSSPLLLGIFALSLVAVLISSLQIQQTHQIQPYFTQPAGSTCNTPKADTKEKCVGDPQLDKDGNPVVGDDGKPVVVKDQDYPGTDQKESCVIAGYTATLAAKKACEDQSTTKIKCSVGLCTETTTGQQSKVVDGQTKLCCSVTISCPCTGGPASSTSGGTSIAQNSNPYINDPSAVTIGGA